MPETNDDGSVSLNTQVSMVMRPVSAEAAPRLYRTSAAPQQPKFALHARQPAPPHLQCGLLAAAAPAAAGRRFAPNTVLSFPCRACPTPSMVWATFWRCSAASPASTSSPQTCQSRSRWALVSPPVCKAGALLADAPLLQACCWEGLVGRVLLLLNMAATPHVRGRLRLLGRRRSLPACQLCSPCPPLLATAAVGRVFTSGEPEMSHNVQRYDQHVYLRAAEAQVPLVHVWPAAACVLAAAVGSLLAWRSVWVSASAARRAAGVAPACHVLTLNQPHLPLCAALPRALDSLHAALLQRPARRLPGRL